ncbi:RNA polymerase sigma factor SigJ [Lentzea flava]|uniref:RNA polymerase sigma factor SigJ n=1 Tax=Lentzea flava TaxID=103732 RepID=A0ABQ2UV21_9PSEU|nr:sigma-70 family RNA polymerase sigma factor [Lentzea flava]MCP2200718.1 RNA polymerase sigma-70 factor, ECF subfamily [Lentzea flava]GGU55081.1 RNA polymerase sigma factor SigJ [Lentzea flava]
MTAADDFALHRAHLIGVAYRLTGSVADAEDAVQEAWLRFSTAEGVRDVRGWLTTVVSRICLDRLRSAAVRRETYVGSWLPEPLLTTDEADDPLASVVRSDGVRMAALVLLDRLTPEQRVAFVLHDAFSLPFNEIADTLGVSEASARQHASRARKAVAGAEPPPRAALAEQQEVLEKFLQAMAGGDIGAVLGLLHPDAIMVGDGGGKVRTAVNTITGAEKIARFFFGLLRKYGFEDEFPQVRPVQVNGDLGVVIPAQGGMTPRVTTFTVHDGKILAVYDIANPDKLGHVDF